ncbi:hypothetical protein KXV77_002030 [Aspergillus fumigatus]|nr:hypothetical protein KXV77_002030 [Aspergillus fumigatus]
MPRQFFVGGNFKMNGVTDTITSIVKNLNEAKLDPSVEVVISPSALYLLLARQAADPKIGVAAQNVFDKPNGAFTGEISVEQLKDAKIDWVIIGHSERRVILKETDEFIARKTKAAIDGGLNVILCIGETLELRSVRLAKPSTSAIGTGKVATTEQAQEVHAAIRKWLSDDVSAEASENVRIIYGGSVSEKNCRDLAKQPDVDGFLVGGASLKPAFVEIVNARL